MRLNRLLFVILLFLSIIFLYLYGGRVPYIFFSILPAIFIVSCVYTLANYRFKYSQEIDRKFVTKGDKVNFLFTVSNEDFFLYPYIKVTFYGDNTIFSEQFQTKSFSLLPHQKKTYSFELNCKYRGYYKVGIKSVELRDFLGLFKFSYTNTAAHFVTVYPKIVPIEKLHLKTNFISETRAELSTRSEDAAIISDIRKYAYGDSIKKIHWKLTAKTNQLHVKSFQNTSETSTIVILDLLKNVNASETNMILEDKLIEAAVSVIYYCLSNWIPVNLVYFNNKLVDIAGKNPLDFQKIYEALAEAAFKESIPVKDILGIYLNDNVSRSNIIIFTSNIDYDLFDQIYKAKFSGYEIILVHISPEQLTGIRDEDADNILDYLPELGVES